jgi:hypothetical protein
MPGARLPMRKIRDMLRLTAAGMSSRKIAASLSIGGTTVVDCLQRALAAGVGWPLPEGLSDAALEARLFPASTGVGGNQVSSHTGRLADDPSRAEAADSCDCGQGFQLIADSHSNPSRTAFR